MVHLIKNGLIWPFGQKLAQFLRSILAQKLVNFLGWKFSRKNSWKISRKNFPGKFQGSNFWLLEFSRKSWKFQGDLARIIPSRYQVRSGGLVRPGQDLGDGGLVRPLGLGRVSIKKWHLEQMVVKIDGAYLK